VLDRLGLRTEGGNYASIRRHIQALGIDTSHFTGRLWNKGLKGHRTPTFTLGQILTRGSTYPSYKLRNRLIAAGLKPMRCEHCGWAQVSPDGRVPLELDHINGDRADNRIENLRILCPNCHSLQPTHRGLNSRRKG